MKISLLPQDATPQPADYVPGNQASSTTTQRFKFSDLIALFWTLANIPAGGTSPITRDNESQVSFAVNNSGIWSGDALGSTLLASMTALTCYINGRRIQIAAVAHRAFTASKDTYIDVLDNGDGTGTLVYTTVTNSAAAPALAANSLRIGKIVTGATNIAAASSIVQWGLDSLGNFIYNTSATASPITIFTNAGTAGGTFYSRNQNGVKEIWGNTGSLSVTGTGFVTGTYGLTFPVGFFNQVVSVIGIPSGSPSNSQFLWVAGALTPTTTAWSFDLNQATGSNGVTAQVSMYVRGF